MPTTTTVTTPETTTDDGVVEETPDYAERVRRLAEKFHKDLVKAEQKKAPSQRVADEELWKGARKAAASQVRSQILKEKAQEITRNAATAVYADMRAAAHRNRRQLAPWLLTAPYAVTGETAHLLAEYGHGVPIGIAAVFVVIAFVVSLLVWRKKLGSRVPAKFTAKVQAGMAMLCGWIAAMPLVHGSGQAGLWLALLAATAYMGLPWWRHHAHPIPLAEDIATLDVTEEQSGQDADVEGTAGDADASSAAQAVRELVDGVTDAWPKRVARPGGAVPGSEIAYTGTTGNAACFAIALDAEGQVTAANIGSRRDRVALAIGVFAHQLGFEQGARVDEVIMRVTLAARETAYTGPVVLCDGTPISSRWQITPGSSVDIVFGPYLDGEGMASYRVIDAGSVNSAFILGSIGSGKTLLGEQIAIALRFIGCELWYVDGQDGASSDMLKHHADWSVSLTPGDVENLYQAIKGVADGRNLELRTQPELNNKYTYDPARPPVITILEEAQEVFRMESPSGATYGILLGQLAQKFRKDGMGFLCISQDFDMTGTFGGSDMLRNCLLAANNFFAMRFTSPARKGMLPAGCPDLQQVPKHGYGYTPMGARPDAMWRAANIEKSPRTKKEWMEAFPPSTLDRLAQRCAGKPYWDRHARAEESMDAGRQRLEFLLSATDEELEADRKKQKKQRNNTAAPSADGPPADSTVVRFPFGTTEEDPAAQEALTDTEQRVLEILQTAPQSPTTLATRLGVSSQAAGRHLRNLAAKNRAVRLEDGRYMAK